MANKKDKNSNPAAENNKDSKENKKASTSDKIADLEKEISNTKYNKRTQFAVGLLKAKLAKLKEKAAGAGKGQKKGEGFSVRKSGDATAILLGFPSVGKSTLLNSLTNANSEIGHYAFTTLTCIPGTLEYNGAKIQILDVPGIVEGAARGTGRGKEVLQVIRNADLIIIVLDAFYPDHYDKIIREVREVGVRINETKPDVKIAKQAKGGIDVGYTVRLTRLDADTIKKMMNELGYVNASVVLREDIDADQLIDVVEANKVYTPAVTIINKIDIATPEQLHKFKTKNIGYNLGISAKNKDHMEELKELIFSRLSFMRIYLKEIGKKADMAEPMIVRSPCSLQNLCERIHKDFRIKFKFARVWGKSVRFDGQKIVKLDHMLEDEDVVELHLK
ncbi:50S ribosome-binding GTPase [Candidatus Woesearchaeota archaeon]|nr:50S ribosome-binding GTPase [Candidatus Woesearchaeota archaeon]